MLDAFCKVLDEMGRADEGVETVLSRVAFARFADFVEEVWGPSASRYFRDGWTLRPSTMDSGECFACYEDFGKSFSKFVSGH